MSDHPGDVAGLRALDVGSAGAGISWLCPSSPVFVAGDDLPGGLPSLKGMGVNYSW